MGTPNQVSLVLWAGGDHITSNKSIIGMGDHITRNIGMGMGWGVTISLVILGCPGDAHIAISLPHLHVPFPLFACELV